MVTLGTAEYPYEVFDNWAQLPHGWSFKEVAPFGFQGVAHVPWREGRTPCIGHLFRLAQ